jgi:hypothetical protein
VIADLLKIPYVQYGRDVSGADCWGLVRIARHRIRGDLIPLYNGRNPDSISERDSGYLDFSDNFGFDEMAPVVGTIAFCFRARLCVHAGIIVPVNGRLMALDSTSKRGPMLQTMRDFAADYRAVKYYDNY